MQEKTLIIITVLSLLGVFACLGITLCIIRRHYVIEVEIKRKKRGVPKMENPPPPPLIMPLTKDEYDTYMRICQEAAKMILDEKIIY